MSRKYKAISKNFLKSPKIHKNATKFEKKEENRKTFSEKLHNEPSFCCNNLGHKIYLFNLPVELICSNHLYV